MADSPTLATRVTELVRTDTKFHSSPTSAVVVCVVRCKKKGIRTFKNSYFFMQNDFHSAHIDAI